MFPPLPKDIYQVELVNVESEQRPTFETRKNPVDAQNIETVLYFQFGLLEGEKEILNALGQPVGVNSLRGRNVWSNFIPTYIYEGKKGKNKLMRILEAFYKHELTAEEKQDLADPTKCKFAINQLVGKQIRVSVEPKASLSDATKIYDNITDWLKATKELEPLNEDEKVVVSKKSN